MKERVIDLGPADWELVDDGEATAEGGSHGLSALSQTPLVAVLGDLLGTLTLGRRAAPTAEALIYADLATDPAALREAAEANAPIEQFLEHVDARKLLRMVVDEGAGEAADVGAHPLVQIGGGFIAGIAAKSLLDKLS